MAQQRKAQTPIGSAMRSKDQGTHQSKERQKVKDPLHGKETKERAKEHATNVDRWVTWQEIAVYECTTWQKRQENKAWTNNTTMRSSTTNNSMTHTTNNGMNKKHGSMSNNGFPEQQAQEYTRQQAPTLQQAQAVSSVKVEEVFAASVQYMCRLQVSVVFT